VTGMDVAEDSLDMVQWISGVRRDKIDRADLLGSAGIDGDDADEFLVAFADPYGVDMDGFRDYLHYNGNEPPVWVTAWGVTTDGRRMPIIPNALTTWSLTWRQSAG